jgi:hypothetical protein
MRVLLLATESGSFGTLVGGCRRCSNGCCSSTGVIVNFGEPTV